MIDGMSIWQTNQTTAIYQEKNKQTKKKKTVNDTFKSRQKWLYKLYPQSLDLWFRQEKGGYQKDYSNPIGRTNMDNKYEAAREIREQ